MVDSSLARRRHSAELRAQVVGQCAAPGASVTQVARAHGLNPSLVYEWCKLARAAKAVAAPALSARPGTAQPNPFVAVNMPATRLPQTSPQEIQIALQRGALTLQISWPTAAAADCAAWMRELLR